MDRRTQERVERIALIVFFIGLAMELVFCVQSCIEGRDVTLKHPEARHGH